MDAVVDVTRPTTLKASAACAFWTAGHGKRRLNLSIQPPDYRCRSILVRHHYGVRWNEAVKNAGCNPNIAAKNVSAAKNGSNLIRAVTHANITVPQFCAKSGGKPPHKGAGWPNIRIIGAGQNGSKILKIGGWNILIGRRRKCNGTLEAGRVGRLISGFQPFLSLSPEEMFCDETRRLHWVKGLTRRLRYKPTWPLPVAFCHHGITLPSLWPGDGTNHESHSPARAMSNKAKKSKPKRVATYTRMSENRPQLSRARQMAVFRKFVKRRCLKIIKNYSDGAKGGGKA